MYINNIVIIVGVVILIVSINLIMKSKQTKKTRESYENVVISETPYPELNLLMNKFNKIYDKEINSKKGLKNFINNYY